MNDIIDAQVFDNNLKQVTAAKVRTALKAITSRLINLLPTYIEINLNGGTTWQNNALKVATNRLMIISAGTVLSSGPVNDNNADPVDWPYPGGDTPESWSHDPATGELWLPTECNKVEIIIRPTI